MPTVPRSKPSMSAIRDFVLELDEIVDAATMANSIAEK